MPASSWRAEGRFSGLAGRRRQGEMQPPLASFRRPRHGGIRYGRGAELRPGECDAPMISREACFKHFAWLLLDSRAQGTGAERFERRNRGHDINVSSSSASPRLHQSARKRRNVHDRASRNAEYQTASVDVIGFGAMAQDAMRETRHAEAERDMARRRFDTRRRRGPRTCQSSKELAGRAGRGDERRRRPSSNQAAASSQAGEAAFSQGMSFAHRARRQRRLSRAGARMLGGYFKPAMNSTAIMAPAPFAPKERGGHFDDEA